MRKVLLELICLLLVSASLFASQQIQPIDVVLSRVSANVKEFRESLPDFVCSEKLTSTYYENDVISRQVIVESVFMGRQQKNGRLNFTESREVLSINGRAVSKRATLPDLPAVFAGGFSSVLQMSFAETEVRYHDYTIPSQTLAGSDVFLITFQTKPDQRAIQILLDGKSYNDRDIGKALIDRESMQVVRLRREFLNIPKEWKSYVADISYARTDIGGRPFWLPQTVTSEMTKKKKNEKSVYFAEYSNCRRFETAVEIKVLDQ